MRRKTFLILTVSLVSILVVSSMLAVSQAWWPITNSEYVHYDLTQVMSPGETTYTDASGYPVVISISNDIMVQGNLKIDDKVYHYPQDFTYKSTLYAEINLVTGDGTARIEKTFTFNLPGKPVLTSWLVVHLSGFIIDPNTGQPVDPANIHTQGEFKLSGTGRFASVEGFGLEQDGHHFGFIKGWPMR